MNLGPKDIRHCLSKVTAQLAVVFLALSLVLIPNFDLIPWAIAYDEKRILEIGLLSMAAGAALFSRQRTTAFLASFLSLPTLARWALFFILISGIVSSALAPSLRHALLEICLFGLLFNFTISLSALTRLYPSGIFIILFSALLSSIFFYEITFFSGYVGTFIQSFPFDARILFAHFSNVRFLNQFQVWTLPLMVLPLILYRGKLNPRLLIFIFFLGVAWWVIVFASRGRGIQLAMLAASLLTLLIFRKHAWPLIKLLGASALLGGFVYVLLFVYLPGEGHGEVVRITGLVSDDGRIILWTSALQMAQMHPWLGVGPGHYAWYPNDIAAHPHNALLQIMSEWGIPAATLFFLLFFWGALAWCRKFYRADNDIRGSEKKHLWIALFCSATAGITYSMVSGVIVMPLGQLMFAAVIGLMLGIYNTDNTTTDTCSVTPPALRQLVLLRLCLGGFLFYLLIAVTPDIITRLENPGPPYNNAPVITNGPRFWQEGGIPH